MSYRVVQKVNNNYYLYEVTAVWDPEKRSSRQKKKYIGKCDAEGNLVTPRNEVHPRVLELGMSYLMYSVAEDMGLRDKFRQIYGDDGDLLYMVGVNRSVHDRLPRLTVSSIRESVLPQLSGVNAWTRFGDVSDLIDLLIRCSRRKGELFQALDKGNDVMVYQINSLKSVDEKYLHADDPKRGVMSMPPLELYLGVSQDPGGVFYYSMRSLSDEPAGNLADVEAEVRALGPRRAVFYLGREEIGEAEAGAIANSGVLFVKPLAPTSEFAQEILDRFGRDIVSEGRVELLNGNLITVLDREIQLGDIRCRVGIMVNEEIRAAQTGSLYRQMAQFEDYVSRTRWSSAAVSRVRTTVEFAEILNLYRFECGDDGRMRAVRDEEAVRRRRLGNGVMMFLTNSDESLEAIHNKHLRLDRFKNEVDTFRNELSDGTMILASVEGGVSSFLFEFVSICLRAHLSEMLGLSTASVKESFTDSLDAVRGIHAVQAGGRWLVSEMTPEQRAVYEDLGFQAPTSESLESFFEEYTRRNTVRFPP